MSAPSVLPQWDSNLTHTTATVAGHKTDGYVLNEIPPSDELNYWMNLVYVWIAYLAGLIAARYRDVPPNPGLNTNWAFDPLNGGMTSLGNGAITNISLGPLVVGSQIDQIRARVKGIGSGSVDIYLRKYDGTGSAGGVVLAHTTLTNPAASWTTYTVTLGTPETISDNHLYNFEIVNAGTGQSVLSLGYRLAEV